MNTTFSIIVLTYNRKECLRKQLFELSKVTYPNTEIIVVDNASDEALNDVTDHYTNVKLIRNNENLGAVGRNTGMKAALGKYIITLDDDVYGITNTHLQHIEKQFLKKDSLGAVNFAVKDELSKIATDWCHPKEIRIWENKTFETNDISEGAVAFKKEALEKVGYYPIDFFISHEGPDLAFRLIKQGYSISYDPEVSVIHTYELNARVSWRRYYYDTRNQLWLLIRHFPVFYSLKQLFFSWLSVFLYALRDGYVRYWWKGISDGIKGIPAQSRLREKPDKNTIKKWKSLEKDRPSIYSKLKRRLKNSTMRG